MHYNQRIIEVEQLNVGEIKKELCVHQFLNEGSLRFINTHTHRDFAVFLHANKHGLDVKIVTS